MTIAFSVFTIGLGLILTATAQRQDMVVVQAASQTTTTVAPPAAAESASTANAVKAILQMRAANEEVLKKQRATLEQLDELQRAAAQLKIFSHRSGG